MQQLQQGYPRMVFPHVQQFCNSIVDDPKPIYIQISTSKDDIENDCVNNVDRHIKLSGGTKVLGWEVFEWYGLMIEAQFHAVWRNTSGELLDVTPKPFEAESSLFIPDSNLIYEGRQINNHRTPLITDARLDEFIQIANKIFDVTNNGSRADEYAIELTDDEMNEYRELLIRQRSLMVALHQSTPGRNDLCRCGTGKKYKKCHGK